MNEVSFLKDSRKSIIDSASFIDLVKILYQIFFMFIEYNLLGIVYNLQNISFHIFSSSPIWSHYWKFCVVSCCFHQRYLCGRLTLQSLNINFCPWSRRRVLEHCKIVLPFLVITFFNQTMQKHPSHTHTHTYTYTLTCTHTYILELLHL